MKHRKILIILLILFFFLSVYTEENPQKPKNWNISANMLIDVNFGFGLSHSVLLGASLVGNYKFFRTSVSYTTLPKPSPFKRIEIELGGQYDFLNSEKLDAILFGTLLLRISLGNNDRLAEEKDEPEFDFVDVLVSSNFGFEFSYGLKYLKLNSGIVLGFPLGIGGYKHEYDSSSHVDRSFVAGPRMMLVRFFVGVKF